MRDIPTILVNASSDGSEIHIGHSDKYTPTHNSICILLENKFLGFDGLCTVASPAEVIPSLLNFLNSEIAWDKEYQLRITQPAFIALGSYAKSLDALVLMHNELAPHRRYQTNMFNLWTAKVEAERS